MAEPFLTSECRWKSSICAHHAKFNRYFWERKFHIYFALDWREWLRCRQCIRKVCTLSRSHNHAFLVPLFENVSTTFKELWGPNAELPLYGPMTKQVFQVFQLSQNQKRSDFSFKKSVFDDVLAFWIHKTLPSIPSILRNETVGTEGSTDSYPTIGDLVLHCWASQLTMIRSLEQSSPRNRHRSTRFEVF